MCYAVLYSVLFCVIVFILDYVSINSRTYLSGDEDTTILSGSIILTLDAVNCSSGTTAVYTRLPLTTSRISMESVVKARI